MSVLDHAILTLMREVSERAIMPRYRNLSAGEIIEKAANDLVTIADREAELMIAEGLARLEGSLAIVGEEAAHADPSVMDRLSGDCWIIDPIDGTHNFARGHSPFGILIARASGGVTHSGWIYDCVTGRFCTAHLERGASINGVTITAKTSGETPPIAAISMVYLDEGQRATMRTYIAPHYRMVDIPGCAAEQYPRLVLGTNDVSTFKRALPWDHAAGILFLEEAGGKCARVDGAPYRVDDWERIGLLGASSPVLWDEFAARVNAIPRG